MQLQFSYKSHVATERQIRRPSVARAATDYSREVDGEPAADGRQGEARGMEGEGERGDVKCRETRRCLCTRSSNRSSSSSNRLLTAGTALLAMRQSGIGKGLLWMHTLLHLHYLHLSRRSVWFSGSRQRLQPWLRHDAMRHHSKTWQL